MAQIFTTFTGVSSFRVVFGYSTDAIRNYYGAEKSSKLTDNISQIIIFTNDILCYIDCKVIYATGLKTSTNINLSGTCSNK